MKKSILLFLILLYVGPALAASQSGQYHWQFDLSAHKPGEEAQLWIPYPTSDGEQIISNIQWSGDYSAAAVYTDRSFGTPMLHVRWLKAAEQRQLIESPSSRSSWTMRRCPIRSSPNGGRISMNRCTLAASFELRQIPTKLPDGPLFP